MFRFAAVSTKHPGFAEERELRVVCSPSLGKSKHLIKDIEVIQGVPQPVYKIPLEDIPEEKLSGVTIPDLIDRIIIGPTRDPLAMAEAFSDLLAKADVDPSNKVFVSYIPLGNEPGTRLMKCPLSWTLPGKHEPAYASPRSCPEP
jgi:hypothetical protein